MHRLVEGLNLGLEEVYGLPQLRLECAQDASDVAGGVSSELVLIERS